MKTRLLKAVIPVCIMCIISFGCEPVVTDINAIIGSEASPEMGIPVEYNPNYVEVALNEVSGETDMPEDATVTDSAEIETDKEEKETVTTDEKEVETDEDIENEEDTEETDEDSEDEDSEDEDKEDGDSKEDEEGEDSEESDEEDADAQKAEGDEEDSDNGPLENASVVPEDFDAEFYAATYPDVVAVFGNSPETLYKHYLEYGKAEGRSCNAEEYSLLNEASQD